MSRSGSFRPTYPHGRVEHDAYKGHSLDDGFWQLLRSVSLVVMFVLWFVLMYSGCHYFDMLAHMDYPSKSNHLRISCALRYCHAKVTGDYPILPGKAF